VRNEQFRMRELIHAQASARAAGALRIVEYEIIGADVSIDEVMRRTAQGTVELFRLRLSGPLGDMDLQQSIANKQRACDTRLDGFFVFPTDHKPVDNGVHLRYVGRIKLDFARNVDGLPIDNQPPAPFLTQIGEDEIQFLTVDLEY